LLDQKFNTGELAHASYLGAAEQVYLSVLDNLLRVVSLLHGASAIDLDYIRQRQEELQGLGHLDNADERELQTLKKREQLRRSHLDQVNQLLTANEESMTAMDETSAAIAMLQTGSGLAEVDMETAMSYLKELAGRANDYEQRQGDEKGLGVESRPTITE